MVSGSFGMMPLFVCRRNQHFFVRKRLTDLRKTGTAGCHIEDPADNGSGLRIYMKGLLITGNPLITVGNTAAAPFAILHPRFENGTDFIAGILGVPLVHDVQERSKVIVRGIGTVNIVVDSDEPNTLGRKLNFCVKSNFQIIASETAHVLYNDSCNVPGFNFGNHGLEAGTIER